MASYLLVMGYQGGLRWVLKHEQMAWREHTATATRALAGGDRLFLYGTTTLITASWWKGSIIGEAEAVDSVRPLPVPVEVGGRTLTHGCDIRLLSLVRPQDAIVLRPFVPMISAFGYDRNPRSWVGHLQRPLVELTDEMAEVFRSRLAEADAIEDARVAYESLLHPY